MKEKGKFQKELERLAYKRVIITVLAGCLFLCIEIFGVSAIQQWIQRDRYLDAVEATFQKIYKSEVDFLKSQAIQKSLLKFLEEGEDIKGDSIRYQLSKYNVDAPAKLNLLLLDKQDELIFTSFNEEKANLHRIAFSQSAVKNARNVRDDIYTTVYFFPGEVSEYVLVCPVYSAEVYMGSVLAFLNGGEWGNHFQKYQYGTVLTSTDGKVIYCSDSEFLSKGVGNKYRNLDNSTYLWNNDNRYLVGKRFIETPGICAYAIIYSPRNWEYIMVGILTMIGIGIVWNTLFLHLIRGMAEKTSRSVQMLVDEIQIIRERNPEHVIHVKTEDEIEEIADQINKMVARINYLNQKNMDLLQVNNRMEIQNLQEQLNPHFIYNTLDNIRFLIAQDAVKADELIGRFTHILRYSINNTKQSVSLEDDLKYIEDYLIIQKTRFGERFTYAVDIRSECNGIQIPKLLLQPLIENSLKYGFQKKNEIYVSIKGWIEENYLVLRVEDDGPGQPKATLETLKSIMHSGEINISHNGLQNINRRIALEYGKESGVTLESKEGEGFTVIIKVYIANK